MISDYFGDRMGAARKKNWEYIGQINERNRQRQRLVIDHKKDAYEQNKRWLYRKWNKDDRKSALTMYKQGYLLASIATYLERDAHRVFDELQVLIVKDALGVKNISQYTPKYRAVPKVNLMPMMDSKGKTRGEWLAILGTAHEFYHRLRGNRKEKDVPAAVAINLAIFLRQPVDMLFDFYKQ
jgi:hypothetical protein